VSRRFSIDLIHPGQLSLTWQEWFVGNRGSRRLTAFILAGVFVLVLVMVAGILPTYWRLSSDLNAIPQLQKDLAASDGDLNVLRTNLQALTLEARRQVRWAELLGAFSHHIPTTMRLQSVEASRPTPAAAPGQPAPPPDAKAEGILRIESVTPVRSGSPPLLEVAQFMAGLMRDPAVNKRFQLKSWDIKPPSGASPEDEAQYLSITILLSERAQ
jgi:hypothetical protein